jgi:hypothetical protein
MKIIKHNQWINSFHLYANFCSFKSFLTNDEVDGSHASSLHHTVHGSQGPLYKLRPKGQRDFSHLALKVTVWQDW